MAITMKNALQRMYRHDWFEQQREVLEIPPGADVTDAAAAFYADPVRIENKLLQLHDDEVSLLEKLIREDVMIPALSNYRNAQKLITSELACIMGSDMSLGIIDEVKEVYGSLDPVQFSAMRRKVSWLCDCVHMIPFLYGILPLRDLCTLYRKRKGFDDPNEEIILKLYKRITDNPVILQNSELYTAGLNDAGNEAKLRQLHKNLPVSFPSYGEIKDVIENGYPSRSEPYKKLKRFLIRDLKQDPSYAEAMMEAVYNYIAKGNTCRDILDLFNQEDIQMNETQKKAVISLLGDCWDDTRMLMVRGARPRDVMPGNRHIFYGGIENG